jgi:hypothetical protein
MGATGRLTAEPAASMKETSSWRDCCNGCHGAPSRQQDNTWQLRGQSSPSQRAPEQRRARRMGHLFSTLAAVELHCPYLQCVMWNFSYFTCICPLGILHSPCVWLLGERERERERGGGRERDIPVGKQGEAEAGGVHVVL